MPARAVVVAVAVGLAGGVSAARATVAGAAGPAEPTTSASASAIPSRRAAVRRTGRARGGTGGTAALGKGSPHGREVAAQTLRAGERVEGSPIRSTGSRTCVPHAG